MSTRMNTSRPRPARHGFRLVLVTAFGMAAMGSAVAASSISAGADTTLGGFTVAAIASGFTASYEQPNLPIPANPSLEVNVGYSNTTDNFGPSGSSLASSLYPGQVIANAGPELGLFLPGVPLPPAPVWPAQATTTCPKGPNATNNTTPGNTMEADCGADSNTATASFGIPGSNATGPPAAPSSGSGAPGLGPVLGIGSVLSSGSPTPSAPVGNDLLDMQGLSSTSTSGAVGKTATATATADANGISVLGGLITIGSVSTTATATATSDGTTGTLSGASTAQHVVIAGQPVTIDSSGIHAAGNPGPGNPVLPVVQQVLSTAGITMTVTNPTDTTKGPQVSRQLDGFRIRIDLTTLDGAANTLSKLVPASVLANLPLPVPNKQILVLDMGWVSVQSAASPAFVFSSGASSSPSPSDSGAFAGIGGTSGTTGTDSSPFGDSGLSTSGMSGTPGSSTLRGTSAVAASPLFKGISGGLLALALLAAVALGLAYLRTQSFIEAAGTGAACPIGETGGGSGGFGGGPGPADDDILGGDPLYSGIDRSLTGA